MVTKIIVISIFVSFILNILFQYVFLKKNIIDSINSRSSHSSIATRSGGLSIFSCLFIITMYFYVTNDNIYDFSLIIPLGLLLVVGLYDDIYKLDFKLKFIFQIIAAKIMIDNGLIIDNLHGFLGIFELNRILAQLLTIFGVVAIINSINFIDGLDGLAISIVLFFLLMFEFFAFKSVLFYLTIIIISSILPIYFFNYKKKNKVFLGDSGSLFLGGVISIYVVFILSQSYIIKPQYDLHKILFIISILVYPIIDMLRIIIVRLYKKKSPFLADKNHIHHVLLQKLKSHSKVVTFIIMISLLNLILIQIIF